jgi:hypothetical protein
MTGAEIAPSILSLYLSLSLTLGLSHSLENQKVELRTHGNRI